MYQFRIHERLPGLNEYIAAQRQNPYKGAKMKKKYTQLVADEILSAGSVRRLHIPVNIHFGWIEKNKRRDKDNIAFAKKFILDAMVEVGLLANDGWRQVSVLEDSFHVDKKNPGVIVVVWEATDGDRRRIPEILL